MTLPRAWVWLSAFSVPVAFGLGLLAGRWTAPATSLAWTELPPTAGTSPAAALVTRADSGGAADAERRVEPGGTVSAPTRPEMAGVRPDVEGAPGVREPELAPPASSANPEEDGIAGREVVPLAYARRAPRTGFGLQVAAHRSLSEAEAFLRAHASRLAPLAPIHVVRRKIGGEEWFRIRVGLFPERARAVAAAERLPAPLDGAMVVRYR